jgi:hypothetical protein
MRPMPDVEQIGGNHLLVYRTRNEYINQIKKLMANPETNSINLEEYSWKEKARQFEEIMRTVV